MGLPLFKEVILNMEKLVVISAWMKRYRRAIIVYRVCPTSLITMNKMLLVKMLRNLPVYDFKRNLALLKITGLTW